MSRNIDQRLAALERRAQPSPPRLFVFYAQQDDGTPNDEGAWRQAQGVRPEDTVIRVMYRERGRE